MAFPIDNNYIHEGRKARDAAQSIVEHSLNASRSGFSRKHAVVRVAGLARPRREGETDFILANR